MEFKDKETLCSLSQSMWEKFSNAADYRKNIDMVYSELLKIKERLNTLDCKTAEDFKTVSIMIEAIDKFYMLDKFPTWEDYERFANELSLFHEKLQEQIDKENFE